MPTFPTELAVHLAKAVDVARRRYRKRLARCKKKCSEEAVHELRVETRRILALLDLLTALQFSVPLKKTRKIFKKRLNVFDDLRDAQVQLRLLKPLWSKFSEAAGFHTVLRQREKRMATKLAGKIQGTKYARLNRRLKHIEKCLRRCGMAAERETGTGQELVVLAGTFRRVIALRRKVKRSNPATIHRLRIAFKQFRYMSELLKPFGPRLTPERCNRMKEYQRLAGEIQDLEVLRARLACSEREEEVSPAEIQNLATELLQRRRRALDSFMARIDDVLEFEPELRSHPTRLLKSIDS